MPHKVYSFSFDPGVRDRTLLDVYVLSYFQDQQDQIIFSYIPWATEEAVYLGQPLLGISGREVATHLNGLTDADIQRVLTGHVSEVINTTHDISESNISYQSISEKLSKDSLRPEKLKLSRPEDSLAYNQAISSMGKVINSDSTLLIPGLFKQQLTINGILSDYTIKTYKNERSTVINQDFPVADKTLYPSNLFGYIKTFLKSKHSSETSTRIIAGTKNNQSGNNPDIDLIMAINQQLDIQGLRPLITSSKNLPIIVCLTKQKLTTSQIKEGISNQGFIIMINNSHQGSFEKVITSWLTRRLIDYQQLINSQLINNKAIVPLILQSNYAKKLIHTVYLFKTNKMSNSKGPYKGLLSNKPEFGNLERTGDMIYVIPVKNNGPIRSSVLNKLLMLENRVKKSLLINNYPTGIKQVLSGLINFTKTFGEKPTHKAFFVKILTFKNRIKDALVQPGLIIQDYLALRRWLSGNKEGLQPAYKVLRKSVIPEIIYMDKISRLTWVSVLEIAKNIQRDFTGSVLLLSKKRNKETTLTTEVSLGKNEPYSKSILMQEIYNSIYIITKKGFISGQLALTKLIRHRHDKFPEIVQAWWQSLSPDFEKAWIGYDLIDIPGQDYNYSKFIKEIMDDNGIIKPSYPVLYEYETHKDYIEVPFPLIHPIPNSVNLGRKETNVNILFYQDMMILLITIWRQNISKIAMMTTQQAMNFIIGKLEEFITHDLTKHVYPKVQMQYERVLQMFRWYAESIVINKSRIRISRYYQSWYDTFSDNGKLGCDYETNGWVFDQSGIMYPVHTPSYIEFKRTNPIAGEFSFTYVIDGSADTVLGLFVDGVQKGIYTQDQPRVPKRSKITVSPGEHTYRFTFLGNPTETVAIGKLILSNYKLINWETEYLLPDDLSGNKDLDQLIAELTTYYQQHHKGKYKGTRKIRIL